MRIIMNNLMGDVPAWAMEDSDEDGDGDGGGGGDIEMQKQDNVYMDQFFQYVDQINADIKLVSKASKDIAIINEKSMRATTTAEEKTLSKKLGPLISTTNKRAKQTKSLLGVLKEDTEKLEAEGKLNASDVRVRENMNTTLTKKVHRRNENLPTGATKIQDRYQKQSKATGPSHQAGCNRRRNQRSYEE